MADPVHSVLPSNDKNARRRYRELSLRCSDQDVFDDLDFITGLANAQNLSSDILLSAFGGQDLFGALLVYRHLGPYREIILPRFCPTTAFLVADGTDAPTGSLVIGSAMEVISKSYHRSALHLAASRKMWATTTNWHTTGLFTYRLDLDALANDVTAGWSASTRRPFRRSSEDYVVSEDPHASRGAIELCAASYARSGRPLPLSISAMADFAENPSGDVRTRIFLATRKGDATAEAGLVTAQKNDVAFYWIAGSTPGPGMTVLVGQVLPILHADGIRTFDFMGANTPSIAEFKRRFGPELSEYVRMSASRSRLLDLAIKIRNWMT